jgi:hypothetical protein
MMLIPDKKMDMIFEEMLFSFLSVPNTDWFFGLVGCPFLKHHLIPFKIGNRKKITNTQVLKTSNVDILRKLSGCSIEKGGILTEPMI